MKILPKLKKINFEIIYAVIYLLLLVVAQFAFESNLFILNLYITLFILITPGFLVYRLIHNKPNPLLIKVSFSLGYSILVLYLAGLGSIVFSNYFDIVNPLNGHSIFNAFKAGYLFLVLLSILKFKNNHITTRYSLTFSPQFFHTLLHLFLPIGSIWGALLMNNGQNNSVAIGIYIFIFLLFSFYIFYATKTKDVFLASYFLFASMALLLSYSIRSNHISGFDISYEYKVFQETKIAQNWNPTIIEDAYQACLSITILPTVLSYFSKISDEFIYKLLITSFFSIIPLNMYYLFRKNFSKVISIGGTFFFISQVWYFAQLPTLIRQGVSYIFFSLILYTIFVDNSSKIRKNISIILLGVGLILSHYTTAYIFISILLSLKIGLLIFKTFKIGAFYSWMVKKIKLPLNSYLLTTDNISFISVLILSLFTFFWFGQLTNTMPNFIQKFGLEGENNQLLSINGIYNKVTKIFSYNFQVKNKNNTPDDFISAYENDLRISRPYLWSELDSVFDSHLDSTTFITSNELQPNALVPTYIRNFFLSIFKVVRLSLNNILLPASILVVLLIKKKNPITLEFMLIPGLLMFCIIILSILPKGLGSYNIERLYLQLLISASVLIIWLLFKILSIFRNQFISNIVCIVFLGIYFFFYAGIAQLITGGNKSLIFYNSGSEYYKNFTHSSEIATSKWLSPYIGDALVFADEAGKNRLIAYGDIDRSKIVTPILQPVLNNHQYVFLSHHNEINNAVLVTTLGPSTYLSTPKQYLNNYKNLTYSTNSTKVYK